MIEKTILMQQHLNTNGNCTFTDLFNCATETIKSCITKMDMALYNKMIIWHLQKSKQALLIEKNNAEVSKR